MIQSMTGYGKAEATVSSGKISVEIRSLNGKNCDISLKTSLFSKDKELQIRQMVADALKRGSIDIFVTFEPNAAESAKTVNEALVREYFRQISDIAAGMGYGEKVSFESLLPSILKMPDILEVKKTDIINEKDWPEIEGCFRKALEMLNAFRSKEGESLQRDVTAKVMSILGYVDEVEVHEQERTGLIRDRIISRFEELSLEPDKSRLEQEMIYYIEKLDINEEKVRLRQHCRYFMDTIENEPCPGKKLGFIAQEMGREINTTGSKANNSDIQKIVVKMKDDLEKIKEQSMNIL